MRFVILGLLLGGPLSLYEVQRRFASVISLFYSASSGSIQRALRTLTEDGFVTVAEDTDSPRYRKLHHVTTEGRAAWRSWMLEPITGSDLEQAMLARVFFLGHLPESGERMLVLATIRTRADAELERLDAIAATRPDAAELARVQMFPFATLDYGVRSTRLALEWLRELETTEAGS
ncbi:MULTISPECIES: PadR family transcriptional regulator [unclassified Pseudoclavibacter]|uniref:PadR family transcriptional regulator n=1 Tax=unclassified Pseudoclavibacter TaxID=2615177 RepID=UPI001BA457DD|nr:PadR family transcriptional regulator [Pseudoclavibacter sp. Marseille-Q4354]MBS3180402.1 PadR family transcriptional regulator [Pseudoclavibacter sp. Marseille-Q4354]